MNEEELMRRYGYGYNHSKRLKNLIGYLEDFSKDPFSYNDDGIALIKGEQIIDLLRYIGDIQQENLLLRDFNKKSSVRNSKQRVANKDLIAESIQNNEIKERAIKALKNSKEYQMAIELGLSSKQSILVKLLAILSEKE